MMMALNAPQEVLKDIWALADADGDGALTKQEFDENSAEFKLSSLIALNVGEFDVASFDPLEAAVGHDNCVLGHLYYRDPMTPTDRGPKASVRRLLRANCYKPRYLDQLARDEVRLPKEIIRNCKQINGNVTNALNGEHETFWTSENQRKT